MNDTCVARLHYNYPHLGLVLDLQVLILLLHDPVEGHQGQVVLHEVGQGLPQLPLKVDESVRARVPDLKWTEAQLNSHWFQPEQGPLHPHLAADKFIAQKFQTGLICD